MTKPQMPSWSQHPDRDFSPFTKQQGNDLYALRGLCAAQGTLDRWHAAVGEMRADGVTVCRPLTVPGRLDTFAARYWAGQRDPNFSVKP